MRARFNPHYTGPLVAGIFALIAQEMRHLRHWQSWGRPVGIGVTRVVMLFAVLLAPFNLDDKSRFATPDPIHFRVQFTNELDAMPGQHLVIVHYSPQHSVFREWVYNNADLDGSKVVSRNSGRQLKASAQLLSWAANLAGRAQRFPAPPKPLRCRLPPQG